MEDFEWNSSKVAAALKKRNLFDDDVEVSFKYTVVA